MTGPSATRGRIDKRRAILDAAVTVFAREGYAEAGVQEIADAAGVAKPTVYNHLVDKPNLFRESMIAAAEGVTAANLAVVERLAEPDDVRAALEHVGVHLLRCHCDERSRAVRQLLQAEAARFPDLIDQVWSSATHRVTQALADRLARLMLTGRLRTGDPVEAAEQLFALLAGPVDARSRFGTREVPTPEQESIARAAVRTFLAAYAS
jgi:AcrR family transcriptional regulator